MSVKTKFKQLTGGRQTQDSCKLNRETGEWVCRKRAIYKDGTTMELAGFNVGVDGGCNTVVTETFENEDGSLERLQGKFLDRIQARCQKKPSDY